MFLAPMDTQGIKIERVLDTLDQFMAGGHGVVTLDGVRVPETAVLGRVGEGSRHAQARLAPARSRSIACAGSALLAARTTSPPTTPAPASPLGKPLGEHEGVGFMLADNAMDLHTCRMTIWHCAWLLDQGERSTT